MTPHRVIVHLDLDAFFASIEILENPALAGKPVAVGGPPQGRGVVSSASYPARAFGVRSAMPTARALALCPHLIVIQPRHHVYWTYSRRVMDILRETAPLVEQMSVDEAFLDVTDQVAEWEESVSLALRIQARVRKEVGLSASLGVATNKLVAKVASDRDKPGGLTVVPPGSEAAFLAPLPVQVLAGIGPVTARKLAGIGITTAGDLAGAPEELLRDHFGRQAGWMQRMARGIDDRPVVMQHEMKSVSQEVTFSRDLADRAALENVLCRLSADVARRLQESGVSACTITLKLRYSDFSTLSRQVSLAVPTGDEGVILQAASALLDKTWNRARAVRLLGVGAHNLRPPTGQLTLW